MKKMLWSVLILVFALCACGQTEPKETTHVQAEADWQTLYMEFLIATGEKDMADDTNMLSYISLNDLDLDGVPELVLSDTGASAANGFAVFQIIENRVELVWGYSALHDDREHPYQEVNISYQDCYTNFGKDWITLRENAQTGEMQYVIQTHNGFYEGTFGSIYSIETKDALVLEVVPEFTYCDYDENIGEPVEADTYQVGASSVTKEEYESQKDGFFAQWADTGYTSLAMIAEPFYERCEYPNKTLLSTKARDLKDFFNQYQSEKE